MAIRINIINNFKKKTKNLNKYFNLIYKKKKLITLIPIMPL